MIKRMTIMLVLCALVLGSVFGYKLFGKTMMMKGMASMGAQPQAVATVKASLQDWQDEIRAAGTLRATKGADLAPELGGVIENVFMESGEDVNEGAVLFQLRAGDDIAKKQALIAQARLAELNVTRSQALIKTQAISQALLDADIATLENLRAQIEAQNVLLQKKTVLAPFSGRLGIRQADVGQYIAAGQVVVTLQQLDPLYLDFSVPQQDISHIAVGQKVEVWTDVAQNKPFEGSVESIGAKVDESTRTISVRATLKNTERLLRPGMFATARLVVGTPRKLITLPQTAVTFNPYGNTVYIVKKEDSDDAGKPQNVARSVFVETGPSRGDQVAILKGIGPEDEVVTAGQLKLRNRSIVTINNSVVPSNDHAPAPEDR